MMKARLYQKHIRISCDAPMHGNDHTGTKHVALWLVLDSIKPIY